MLTTYMGRTVILVLRNNFSTSIRTAPGTAAAKLKSEPGPQCDKLGRGKPSKNVS